MARSLLAGPGKYESCCAAGKRLGAVAVISSTGQGCAEYHADIAFVHGVVDGMFT